MRLEANIKMGYYPTPPKTLSNIIQTIQMPRKGHFRIYDPCVGEGKALYDVQSHMLKQEGSTVESYGVEVSEIRAQYARDNIDHVLESGYEDVSVSPSSMSLLWLNPPYDYSHETATNDSGEQRKARQEYVFLRDNTKKLMPGGLLIYIVPVGIFERSYTRQYIARNYRDIRIWSIDPDEHEIFKQVVLFGYRREAEGEESNEEVLELMAEIGAEKIPDPMPDAGQVMFDVPIAPRIKDFIFKRWRMDPDELLAAAVELKFHEGRQWQQFAKLKDHTDFQPAVPLRKGHIASLVASGQIGTMNLGDVVVKGRTTKLVDQHREEGPVQEDGKPGPEIVTETERFVATITMLSREGQITQLTNAKELSKFLDEYKERIARIIDQRYRPLYESPEKWEWQAVSRLMRSRVLPGRKERGLLKAQKHTAIALSRVLRRDGWGNLVGEMGTGKTATSLATLELLDDAWPVVVLSPKHVANKWAKEVTDVIPDAKGEVIESLGDLQSFIRNYRKGQKKVVVISTGKAKLAPKRKNVYHLRHRRLKFKIADGIHKDVTANIVHCPRCGRALVDKDGKPYVDPDMPATQPENNAYVLQRFLPLPRNTEFCNSVRAEWQGDPFDNRQGTLRTRDRRTGQNLICGEALWQHDNESFRRWPLADYLVTHAKDFFRTFIADEVHEYEKKDTIQARAYHRIADACHYRMNLTGTLFGGKSTSLFWMLYRNDAGVRADYGFNDESKWAAHYGRLEYVRNENPDGTPVHGRKSKASNRTSEIPGISPSIFSRLLPNTIFLKISNLGWKLPECKETIVRLPMGEEQGAQYEWFSELLMEEIKEGLKSFNKDKMMRARRLLSVWLQRSLGRPNTGFRRESVLWKFSEGKQDGRTHRVFDAKQFHTYGVDYSEAELDPAIEDKDIPDLRLYQDPEFIEARDELRREGANPHPLFLDRIIAPGSLLPKEEWLRDKVAEEIAAGEKVIIYCRQTGHYNIQDRLKNVLSDYRVQILPKNIDPGRRGKWIEDNAHGMQVLICNPEMVKTGLDLVQFSTIIYYELSYSLYTMQQSMKRIYRLGQTRNTKIFFAVYANTMEDAALGLIGEKAAAANLLYGDTAESAISAGSSGDNLLKELSQRMLDGDAITSDGIETLLSANNDETSEWDDMDIELPVEDPEPALPKIVEVAKANPDRIHIVRPARPEPELQQLSWADMLAMQEEAAPKKKVRKKVEAELQLSLF